MYTMGSGNPELSHLPVAAVTDYHKGGGLKQQKFISHSEGGWKCESMSAGSGSTWRPQGEDLSLSFPALGIP